MFPWLSSITGFGCRHVFQKYHASRLFSLKLRLMMSVRSGAVLSNLVMYYSIETWIVVSNPAAG